MEFKMNTMEMDREIAILCFGGRFFEDERNHQYGLKSALEVYNTELDLENVKECKEIEKDYEMCAIDYFVSKDDSLLVIQSKEYLEYANLLQIEELWNRYNNCKIGFREEVDTYDVTVYNNYNKFRNAVELNRDNSMWIGF